MKTLPKDPELVLKQIVTELKNQGMGINFGFQKSVPPSSEYPVITGAKNSDDYIDRCMLATRILKVKGLEILKEDISIDTESASLAIRYSLKVKVNYYLVTYTFKFQSKTVSVIVNYDCLAPEWEV